MANEVVDFKGQVLGTTSTGETRQIQVNDDGELLVDIQNAAIEVEVAIDDIITAKSPVHNDFNANANLQVADTDVSNANPVPVDVTVCSAASPGGRSEREVRLFFPVPKNGTAPGRSGQN
jgi:hypothetical protein